MSAIQKHRRLLGEAVRNARKEDGFSLEKLAEKTKRTRSKMQPKRHEWALCNLTSFAVIV